MKTLKYLANIIALVSTIIMGCASTGSVVQRPEVYDGLKWGDEPEYIVLKYAMKRGFYGTDRYSNFYMLIDYNNYTKFQSPGRSEVEYYFSIQSAGFLEKKWGLSSIRFRTSLSKWDDLQKMVSFYETEYGPFKKTSGNLVSASKIVSDDLAITLQYTIQGKSKEGPALSVCFIDPKDKSVQEDEPIQELLNIE